MYLAQLNCKQPRIKSYGMVYEQHILLSFWSQKYVQYITIHLNVKRNCLQILCPNQHFCSHFCVPKNTHHPHLEAFKTWNSSLTMLLGPQFRYLSPVKGLDITWLHWWPSEISFMEPPLELPQKCRWNLIDAALV